MSGFYCGDAERSVLGVFVLLWALWRFAAAIVYSRRGKE